MTKELSKEEKNNKTAFREISKDDLKKVLTNHSLWLGSEKKGGQAANLEGYNLRGAVLLGANLKKANLKVPTFMALI